MRDDHGVDDHTETGTEAEANGDARAAGDEKTRNHADPGTHWKPDARHRLVAPTRGACSGHGVRLLLAFVDP